MPVPSRDQSSVTQKATKKWKRVTGFNTSAPKKTNTNPPVVNLVGEAEDADDADSSVEDTSSAPQPPVSLSSQSHGKRKRPGGPKKKSSVWKFFAEEKETNVTRCSNCDYQLLPACHTGNAVNHLQIHHADVFKEFLNLEEGRKEAEKVQFSKTSTVLSQPKIKFESSDPYPVTHPRYRIMLRECAVWVLQTTATVSLCSDPATKRLFLSQNPRSPTIGRFALNTEMDKVFNKLLQNMKMVLKRANKVALAADIWSKRGMSESFLGVTARMYDPSTKSTRSSTLACRSFPTPHTAKNVHELIIAILKEWEIPKCKVSAIVTDNGSNMVAAFKEAAADSSYDEEWDCPEVVCDEQDQEDVDTEVTEYIAFEEDCEELFAKSIKRHSYAIHRLQTSVRAFEMDEKLKPILQKARRIVRTFRKSNVATEELLKVTELTLVADVSTRWNSTLLFLKRLDLLKDAVQDSMVKHLKIPSLTPGEWMIIKYVIKLLDKFNTVTDRMSAEYSTTIHRVHFYVNGLTRHLESVRDALLKIDFDSYGMENPFSEVILAMTSELDRVLGYVMNENEASFDGIFLACVFLHNKLKSGLHAFQKDRAVQWLAMRGADWYTDTMPERNRVVGRVVGEVRSGCEDGLDFFIEAESEVSTSKSPLDLELQAYREVPTAPDERVDDDNAKFWVLNAGKFPLLSRLALDLLAIPASSAAPERVFSIATVCTMGKANRLAGRNLERKVLSFRNTMFLPGVDD